MTAAPAIHHSAGPRPSLARRAPIALLGAFLFLACCFPMMDTDFWWHLRTGELIWETGQLPDLDWYTFTDSSQPWIDLHWGFQLFITAVWHLGGANLVVLVKAAVYTLAVLIALHAAGAELSRWQRAAFWILPAIAISGRAYERPEMLSLVFLATWLWIVHRSEKRPGLLWWLVPLQLAWTNCHALSVLGLVTGACLAIDRLTRKMLVPRGVPVRWGLEWTSASGLQLLIVGTLVGATAFLNPWFEEGAFFPLVLYRKFSVDRDLYSTIGEFQRPIDFYHKHGLVNPYLFVEAWLWAVVALSLVFLLVRGRWSPFRLLMFAGFSHLAWAASRNTSIFSLVAGVILCANARDLLVLAVGNTSGSFPELPRRRALGFAAATGGLLVMLTGLVVTSQWARMTGEYKPFGLGEREAWFGHEAMIFAGQKGLPERALIYHNGLAGVYIWHNSPRCKVFMDARLEVTTPQTFRRHRQIQRQILAGDPAWTYSLRDANGHLPVLILDSRYSRYEIGRLLGIPALRLVYCDHAASVFVETIIADRLNLPTVSPEPLMERPPN